MNRSDGCVPLTDTQRAEAERHLKLCGYAAKKFARKYPHVSWEEWLSAAFDGLADAVRAFDESRGVALECYAPARIEGACLDMLRRARGGVVHIPKSAGARSHRIISIDAHRDGKEFDTGAGRGDTLADLVLPSSPPPEAALSALEDFERLLVELSATERFILRKVYGPEEWTFVEVAAHLGYSPSRIAQIHAAAVLRVAARALRLGLEPGAAPPSRGTLRPRRAPSSGRTGRPVKVVGVDATEARRALAAEVGVGVERLEAALAGLRPHWRAAVVLRRGLDGTRHSWGGIALRLGLSRSGAEYSCEAGLARLREGGAVG